jgi:endonuclease-3
VPRDRAALTALPGVGNKTAGVVMMAAYGADVIPVDTHVFRLAHRIGLCSEKASTPDEVEKQLDTLIPEGQRAHMHHLLIWHGRRCCKAQKPNCAACPLKGAECAWSLQEQSCL